MNFDLGSIVALLLTASGGAFIREVLVGIAKLRAGVPGSEHGRKVDVISQRDDAVSRAAEQEHDVEVLQQYISDLREFCLSHGTALHALPPRPILRGAPR